MTMHNIEAILQASLLPGSLAHKLTNWLLQCLFTRDLYNVLMSSSVLQDEMLIWAWLFVVTRFNSAEAPMNDLQCNMGKLAQETWCGNRGTQHQHLIQSLSPEGLSGLDLQAWGRSDDVKKLRAGEVWGFNIADKKVPGQIAKIPSRLGSGKCSRNCHVRPCEERSSLRPCPSVSCTSSVRRKAMTP